MRRREERRGGGGKAREEGRDRETGSEGVKSGKWLVRGKGRIIIFHSSQRERERERERD